MRKRIHSSRYLLSVNLFILLFLSTSASLAFAQGFEAKTGQDLVFSTTILSIAANVSSERMSVSYNGLTGSRGFLFLSDKKIYDPGIDGLSDSEVSGHDGERIPIGSGGKLNEITRHLFKYFKVEDCSSNSGNSMLLLKGRVNKNLMDTNQVNPDNFEFNLSFSVGGDNDTPLKMNAIKMESYWHQTCVNAVYHTEKKEFELGLSSAYLNDFLLKGMKLELQANPAAGTGAVLFTMNL